MSKMPIFRVKSVKIYTGQKKFTRVYPWYLWQIRGMVTASFKTRKLQFLASEQTSIASTQVVALTPFSQLAPSYVFFHPKKEK